MIVNICLDQVKVSPFLSEYSLGIILMSEFGNNSAVLSSPK